MNDKNKKTDPSSRKEAVEALSTDSAPSLPQILNYFEYRHLPAPMQKISKPFCVLAFSMVEALPNGAERAAGLRKLLEAKDCFVRASL